MNFNPTKFTYSALFMVAVSLSSCGGGAGGGATTATDSFTVDETLSAALVDQGMPLDVAEFFAAAKFSSNCSSDTSCTFLYTYPNGAKRELTMTATSGQYTPTADELANTASITKPVFDGTFAATGIEDTTPPVDTQTDISYFVPTASLSKSSLTKAQASNLTKKTAKAIAKMRAPAASTGYQFNLSESGSKGADVAIGSILDHYKDLGKSAKTTGSVYAIASALSDIAGAAIISQQVNAWLAELDSLEKCASDPTNPLTQSDPTYTDTAVATVQAARAELKQLSAVRFLNAMDETAMGITPVTAVLSIPLKQANAWTEQTLKDLSEKLMEDVRKSVVSCKPSCPANFSATGVSESRIDLSWTASTVSSGVDALTSYILSGGNANGVSTAQTTFPDIGLARSTQYCYTISAYNDYGAAESCPQACGTTFGPPVIHSTGPNSDATNVSVKTAVTATFSEEVDPATVTAAGTFTLTSSSGAVSYSGTTATFTPSADLAYSTKYTATVTTAVLDLDGIPMEADHTWSFTTEAAPVAGNLQFSLSLAGGTLTSSGTANVTWTKFEDLGDVRRYVPSGTITADIVMENCDPIHATVPIEATVPNGPGPTLVVYTAINVAFPNSYGFSLVADPNTILTFMCGSNPKTAFPMPAPITIGVGSCTSFEPQPFTDEAHLAGTYSCLETGLVSATWDFSK